MGSLYRWRALLDFPQQAALSAVPFVDLAALGHGSTSRLELRVDLGGRHGPATGARLMFFAEGQVRVLLYGLPCDMGKSFDGLQALVRQGCGGKKMVSAQARRAQVAYVQARGVSQRQACALLSVARSTPGYKLRLAGQGCAGAGRNA